MQKTGTSRHRASELGFYNFPAMKALLSAVQGRTHTTSLLLSLRLPV